MKHLALSVLLLLLIISMGIGPGVPSGMEYSVHENYSDSIFTEILIDPSGSIDPWEKAMADLTGDGKLDMILGSPTGPLVYYPYPDWEPINICGEGSYRSACGIATADMDYDGDTDVIMGGIFWYENPLPSGEPSEGNWEKHTIGEHRSHDLCVADLDNDGKLEIVSRWQGSNGRVIRVYKEELSGGWEYKELHAVFGEGLAIADFDSDGDIDIAIPAKWYENPGDIIGGTWKEHFIDLTINQVAQMRAADINGDGRPDLVFTAAEQLDDVVWMECPVNPADKWTKHIIFSGMNSAHGIGVGDFDGDGTMDVTASEFRGHHRLMIYYNIEGGGTIWSNRVIGTQGMHNIAVGDYDKDGDIDIFGAPCWGNPEVYVYRNESKGSATPPLSLDNWTYIQVDDKRDARAFGLGTGDGTGDGYTDIVSGDYFYRNPGSGMSSEWDRTDLPFSGDANFILDVDGDEYCDIISQSPPNIYWFEANDTKGGSFSSRVVAEGIPPTKYGSSQGFILGQINNNGFYLDIERGGFKFSEIGRPEYVFTSYGGIFWLSIPDDPASQKWKLMNITTNSTEEGIGMADLDGDDFQDIVGWVGSGTGSRRLGWWRNPGATPYDWDFYNIGSTEHHLGDRIKVVDINGDGIPDVVATETNSSPCCSDLYWFEAPADPKTGEWIRHTVASDQGGLNSMDAWDMDKDGDVDIITGEHRGMKNLKIWENLSKGSSWKEHLIDSGKESHLGARVVDMDGDGDLDILSICWDDKQYLHLWRNDAITEAVGSVSTNYK